MERHFRVTYEVRDRLPTEPVWEIVIDVEADGHEDAMQEAWRVLADYPEQYHVTCVRITETIIWPWKKRRQVMTGPVVTPSTLGDE